MTGLKASPVADPARLRVFTRAVLRDLRALEQMIADGLIESGVRRIGAEQELALVDKTWRPAPRAVEILADLDDDRFTHELGLFNLEFNLPPILFGGDCLSLLETGLREAETRVREVAARHGTDVVLTGILPTLRQTDLDLDNMSPLPRYRALNDALMASRGSEFELRLRGTDEINVKHDSVMLESCNTSVQFHFQVAPAEFARLYNIAQLVAAPILSVACNSPFIFGKRLWRETRIAVFEQSIDTRRPAHHIEDRTARVSFGNDWVRESVLEVYQDDITRFRAYMGLDVDEDPFVELAEGRIPRLRALSLHNGTVYRWNRPCYGISGGKPHLRIENRILPAGPTLVDEIANAAFWYGLMSALAAGADDVRQLIEFDAARANFIAAARQGLDAHLTWTDGRRHAAADLIADQLLPLAESGLRASGVDIADIRRYLGIIRDRVATRQTGAEWMMKSYAAMGNAGTSFERLRALVGAMSRRRKKERPVHDWPPARLSEAGRLEHNYDRIGQYMTTDLFTVHENEVIDLVASVMAWRNIRHVPVEDDDHRLVGLVSSRSILRFIAQELPCGKARAVPVSHIMQTDPVTVTPETSTLEAIERMRENGISCLPVVKNDRLVGIVSEHDFVTITAHLLEGRGERKA